MTNDVRISYSEYGSTAVIDKAEFELSDDMRIALECEHEGKKVSLAMFDTLSEGSELCSNFTYEELCVFIRILTQLRNQIKNNGG